jgi:cytochrome c oxidase subunit 1
MPRRYYDYLPEFTFLHQVSTVGSWILGLGFLIMAGYLFASLRKPFDAPSNPWHARTLDWQTSSPPITHNFHETPVLKQGPYDYFKPFEPSVEGYHE